LISLQVMDSDYLQLFYGLKSLRKINISQEFYTINKINEIFDPSQIFELEIEEVISGEE
jgi:hypothetical protein